MIVYGKERQRYAIKYHVTSIFFEQLGRSHRPRSRPFTVERRSFKNFDLDRFCEDLQLIPFDAAYIFDEIDDIYWAWSYLLTSVLHDHATIKRRDVKRAHVPFTIPELLHAIRKRNRLKRIFHKSKCRIDWDRYKTQRNFASSVKRKLISNYLRTTSENANGNPKRFWQKIKPFMHSRNHSSQDSIHFKEGDTLIIDKLEVVSIFSEHFSSILKDIDSYPGHHTDDIVFTSHPSLLAIQNFCSTNKAFQFRSVSPFAANRNYLQVTRSKKGYRL